jgi:NAD(P)H-dependent flavin oxidoreductase YrpB (nitropropane dioxygenase family)
MSFVERLDLEHPVVQAGMGGGLAAGRLAGAVSAAGALGTVGTMAPEAFRRELLHAREIAGAAPVAANLLVPFARRAHVEACQKAAVAAVFLHAGRGRALIRALRDAGLAVLQTIGTAQQARRALSDGADGLVLQGIDAGGHLLGVRPALEVLPEVLAVSAGKPVLVAGGIADGADTARALNAGATAVVAGTRFLLTDECEAHPLYKQRVLETQRTIETRLFGLGWPMRHRVVPNAATDRWCRRDRFGPPAIRALQRLSVPLARLPFEVVDAGLTLQRAGVPLFSPSVVLAGMPDRLVETSALYAGETALRIGSVLGAREAVELLAGTPGRATAA